MSFAITPKAKGDEEKMAHLAPAPRRGGPDARRSAATSRRASSCSSGLTQMHVEVAVERLRRRFDVDVELHQPRVPYHETIRKEARAHARYKKQTGGRGQFGDCAIVIEPIGEERRRLRVRRRDRRRRHPAGLPARGRQGRSRRRCRPASSPARRCQGVRVRLVDGSYHTVDSSEMAFKIAGSMAFKQAYEEADPVLLEPIMEVE